MKLIIKIIMLISLSLTAQADVLSDLTKDMNKRVDRVVEVLGNNELTRKQQNVELEIAGEGLFDYTLMARLSIGKKEWKKLSSAQKQEFATVFEKNMKDSYIEKSHLLGDDTVTVHEAIQAKKTRIHLSVSVEGQKEATTLTYKYYQKKGKWLVYDVEIAGVSILQTYRAQFAEILEDDDINLLIKKLKESQSS